MTKLEEVARAILPMAFAANDTDSVAGDMGLAREMALGMARAAVGALREPPEGVVMAMCDAAEDEALSGGEGDYIGQAQAATLWRAGVDSILSEGQPGEGKT